MVLQSVARILVVNAGSSSLKFKLFDNHLTASIGGLIERIGDTFNSTLVAKSGNDKWSTQLPIKDHVAAMECVMGVLKDKVSPQIHREVQAVGHRIVHGLDIHKAVLLDEQAIDKIKLAASLAPLHNPPGLQGVAAARKVFAEVPQVQVLYAEWFQ
eukprot:GHRR01010266.1.p1 GENE.GHRR01010266.1~~GHRR01010266.1.p1  ORF type:complete len:156 (+),score=32.95 GHRR01010266.1:256-723(+)